MPTEPGATTGAPVPGAGDGRRAGGRVLDPVDRNFEILFGLFMVLTFTGTLSVTSAGREDVRVMLIAAIGCNIAWGLVDAVVYVLRNLVARGHQALVGRKLRAASPQEGRALIAEELGPLADGLQAASLERIRERILAQPAPAGPDWRSPAGDLKGALAVFLLVFGSTFPVVLPFVFVGDLHLAMRLSGLIAIAMMFGCGYALGRHAGLVAWRSGLVMVALGVTVEAIVIALGG